MAKNQWNTGDPIYQKCADPDCSTQVRRTPSQVKKGLHLYCSMKCTYNTRKARKYQESDITWIIENTGKVTREEMAGKFGSNREALQRMISKWRAAGYAIPLISSTTRSIPKYHLTEGQKTWIIVNFERIPFTEMEELINIPRRFLKNFIDHLLKTRKLFRKIKIKSVTAMPKKPEGAQDRRGITSGGNKSHSSRKPPVNDAPAARSRDEKLPTRVIDTSSCIKVIFKDKNHTTFTARDEAHVARIRKAYASFEERFGSQLVYP